MTRVRNFLLGLLGAAAVAVLVGSCAAPAVAPPATTPTASAAPAVPSATPAPGPGLVDLTGDLRRPGRVTLQQLAALPQHTVSVQYTSGKGPETRTETGVLLADLVPPDALATTDRKNDLLSFAVLAVGADGYAALVSYGEISPDFGNRGILLATSEDGAALDRPRLVVPGDRKGGRYVSEVTALRVVRAAA